MKVIGAGFGRTGTMSLKVALEELGAGPCLHPLEVRSTESDGQRLTHWQRIADGERVDWREAFDGFQSTVDWLGARFVDEMVDTWPQARVILSVRDPHAWYESCHDSLHATSRLGEDGSGSSPAVLALAGGVIWDDIFDGRFGERDYALEVFDRHNRQVTTCIPDERLLVYDIRQGWEPLCEFLGVAVPDRPFPHLNDRSAFWARFGPTSRITSKMVAPRPRVPATSLTVAGETIGSNQSLPRIGGLAVANPPNSFSQEEVLDRLGLHEDEFAQRIFSRSGVQRRFLVLDEDFLAGTLQGRTPRVERELMDHTIRAVEKIGVDPQEIGSVISASLYSLGCPTLAHKLIEHFQMDPATDKYHLTGVGCASAIPLMRLACASLHQHPGKHSLVVAAESMSGLLMPAQANDTRAKTVGSAIFGDGCAAALVSCEPDAVGPTILASQVHQIGGTLGAVTMTLQEQDSYLHLARELPEIAAEDLAELVRGFLANHGYDRSAITHWMVHPGGRRIIERVQEALDLTREDLAVSWESLASHGNVGTPSIFYVLKDTIARRHPAPSELGLAVTIGPGVTVGLMLLRW